MHEKILNIGYYIFAIYIILANIYFLKKNKFKFNEIVNSILLINVLIVIKYSNIVSESLVILGLIYIIIISIIKFIKKKSINKESKNKINHIANKDYT